MAERAGIHGRKELKSCRARSTRLFRRAGPVRAVCHCRYIRAGRLWFSVCITRLWIVGKRRRVGAVEHFPQVIWWAMPTLRRSRETGCETGRLSSSPPCRRTWANPAYPSVAPWGLEGEGRTEPQGLSPGLHSYAPTGRVQGDGLRNRAIVIVSFMSEDMGHSGVSVRRPYGAGNRDGNRTPGLKPWATFVRPYRGGKARWEPNPGQKPWATFVRPYGAGAGRRFAKPGDCHRLLHVRGHGPHRRIPLSPLRGWKARGEPNPELRPGLLSCAPGGLVRGFPHVYGADGFNGLYPKSRSALKRAGENGEGGGRVAGGKRPG